MGGSNYQVNAAEIEKLNWAFEERESERTSNPSPPLMVADPFTSQGVGCELMMNCYDDGVLVLPLLVGLLIG